MNTTMRREMDEQVATAILSGLNEDERQHLVAVVDAYVAAACAETACGAGEGGARWLATEQTKERFRFLVGAA